ncbi:hypothetical protein HID58_087180 [Brassica napus]|uniref:Pentatricopeptide repeat-containing protein n=1 Tax=Brassica napus TaxID=3708 RepID=A0ABQ7XSJ0_BRANA|nr:hypothetical protein HID58_087180 [Brassica napus]
MLQSDDSKHILKLNVCYVYLHAVRSLTKQMKSSGVIPDSFVLNLIIKAYAMCLEVDEAIRVFREKGRVAQGQGLGFYKAMRSKGMVPSGSSYIVLICSVAMERRLDEAGSLFGGNSGPVPFPASMRRFNYGGDSVY